MEEAALILKDFPASAVVKPRTSSGSQGLLYVSRSEDLLSSYRDVHARHPFPIVQERIPAGGRRSASGPCTTRERRGALRVQAAEGVPCHGRVVDPSHVDSSPRGGIGRRGCSIPSTGTGRRWSSSRRTRPTASRDFLGEPSFLGVAPPRHQGRRRLPWLLYRMAVDGDDGPVREYRTGVVVRSSFPGRSSTS